MGVCRTHYIWSGPRIANKAGSPKALSLHPQPTVVVYLRGSASTVTLEASVLPSRLGSGPTHLIRRNGTGKPHWDSREPHEQDNITDNTQTRLMAITVL